MRRSVRFLFWLVAIALLPGGLGGCSRSVPQLSRLEADAVVLAYGDSLTSGVGAVAGASYPDVLQSLIGRRVVAAGVPGELTAKGLARLPKVLAEVHPGMLILCHGGNDFLRRRDDAGIANNLRGMVKLARDQDIAVVLVATPKPGIVLRTPDLYRDIAREYGLPLENNALRDVLADDALKADLVHPNAQGYRRLAEAIAALLRKSGAI